MKKITNEISSRAIRAMPYESRLKWYEKEKDELFSKIQGMRADEVSKAHRELIDKWRV